MAFPTETVYGLGASARDPRALARLYAAKGRPPEHPVIVHLPSALALTTWAREVPDAAWRLAETFWPGPLTLVLSRAADVPDEVTGGQDTVGLRVPDHPLALRLLQAFAGGVAAPSANRFGRISPTTAGHVVDEFADLDVLVLDGGACRVGLESTIVDLSGGAPRILRPGGVHRRALEEALGERVALAEHLLEREARPAGGGAVADERGAPRSGRVAATLRPLHARRARARRRPGGAPGGAGRGRRGAGPPAQAGRSERDVAGAARRTGGLRPRIVRRSPPPRCRRLAPHPDRSCPRGGRLARRARPASARHERRRRGRREP